MMSQIITGAGVEVDKIRQDPPILSRSISGSPLFCLDNASLSLKLRSILDRRRYFYEFEYANTNEENSASQNATKAVEYVRSSIADPLRTSTPEEIVPLHRATGAMKLVAHAFEPSQLQAVAHALNVLDPDRAAFMFYNTEDECDRLCESLRWLS